MKKLFKLLFVLVVVMILPILVKADTWLDNPSYYDISWYDPDNPRIPLNMDGYAYYVIDSKEKLAGLLHLVNIDGYSFNKTYFLIKGDTSFSFCAEGINCALDMSAHDWVPVSSSFKGVIIIANWDNVDYKNNKVYLEGSNNDVTFFENKYCTVHDSSGFVNETYTCEESFVYHGYKIYSNTEGNGTIDISNRSVKNRTVIVNVNPSSGYHLESLEVIDANNNKISTLKMDNNKYSFLMPSRAVTVNATFSLGEDEEVKCYIIRGNGKNIGDEVACGDEHFYILSNKDDEVQMLAKYNLHTGVSIYKEKIEKEEGDTRTDTEYCEDLAASKGGTNKHDDFYNAPGYCFYRVILPTNDIKQTEDSKSAHWDEDLNYLYPQVGDVYMYRPLPFSYITFYSDTIPDDNPIEDTDFYNYELNLDNIQESISKYTSGTGVVAPLYLYKERLMSQGFDVKNITLLSLSELNDIVKKINNNQSLPLKNWSDNVVPVNPYPPDVYMPADFGSLKEYIPNEYKWLYSTTYWNRTIYYKDTNNPLFVFTAEQGKICGAGIVACAPETTLGCGIRPVLTVSPELLVYQIKTETDEYSGIEVIKSSPAEEPITFKLNIAKGHRLKKLIIRSDGGEEVEFTNGELVNNADGSISIKSNLFTMPYDNVTIIANTESTDTGTVYIVEKEETNCTIMLSKNSNLVKDEEVIFTIKSNEGYEVASIKVNDKNKNEINYTKDDENYKFNMPDSDVKVIGVCNKKEEQPEIIDPKGDASNPEVPGNGDTKEEEKPVDNNEKTPITSDMIIKYVVLFGLSIIGILFVIRYNRKFRKEN